jgi:hypothetical protein
MIEIIGTADQQTKFRRRIKQPVDQIAADVLDELGLHGAPYRFKIILRGNASDVQEHYRAKYGKTLSSHSYTSREESACYISVADVNLRVIAHELAHMALNQYFTTDKVPTKLHELIAQAVEERTCKKYSRWFW